MMRRLLSLVLCVSWWLVASHAAWADDVNAQARSLLSSHQDAIVQVKLVFTMRAVMMGRESAKQEQRFNAYGTVLDASGLTIIAHLQGMDMGDNEKLQVKREVTDVRIQLADGTELPAQMVLSDNDLGIAFVKPREAPPHPLAFVNFGKAPDAAVLDSIITVHRYGASLNNTAGVSVSPIHAVMHKPRTFYVVGDMISGLTFLGCPGFNQSGDAIGIYVLKMGNVRGENISDLFGQMQPVLLPASEWLDAAKQAAAGNKKS
jgi:hypothetical protein